MPKKLTLADAMALLERELKNSERYIHNGQPATEDALGQVELAARDVVDAYHKKQEATDAK